MIISMVNIAILILGMHLNYRQYKEINNIEKEYKLEAKKSFWYREIFLKNLTESLSILKTEIKNLSERSSSNKPDDPSNPLQIRRSLLNKTKPIFNSIYNINNYIFIDSELRYKMSLKFEAIEDILGSQQEDYLSILSEINKFEIELYNELYSYEMNAYESTKREA